MTPLALRIVKDMTLPVRRRTFDDKANVLKHFRNEFHCFEVTQVYPLAEDLVHEMLNAAFPSVAWSFLPAQRTWLEYKDEEGARIGFMLVRKGDWADVYVAFADARHDRLGGAHVGQMALADALAKTDPSLGWKVEDAIFKNVEPYSDAVGKLALTALWKLYAFLLLINTPKVVGRQTHDPHRALARHILANRNTLGIFPLQAWTEITLATDTIDASDEAPKSSRTSGTMPLHWTRAHKRRVHGIWTLISDYWSGDGSLGIKQSRYKVVPSDADK